MFLLLVVITEQIANERKANTEQGKNSEFAPNSHRIQAIQHNENQLFEKKSGRGFIMTF